MNHPNATSEQMNVQKDKPIITVLDALRDVNNSEYFANALEFIESKEGGKGWYSYNIGEYIDLAFSVTYLTEEETGDDYHSFDPVFTINTISGEESISLQLGTNTGGGGIDGVISVPLNQDNWAQSALDAIKAESDDKAAIAYKNLVWIHPEAHDAVIEAIKDLETIMNSPLKDLI